MEINGFPNERKKMTTYYSTTETAKLVRKVLKAKFPTTKFSVRSSIYAGGSSISVTWTDGPSKKEIDSVVKFYEGAEFDGMIDMKSYVSQIMILEGESFPTEVRFGADFVFTYREMSAEFKASLIKKFEQIAGTKYDDNTMYPTIEFGYYQMPQMYGCQIINYMFHDEKVGA